jgi:hypothetical protein
MYWRARAKAALPDLMPKRLRAWQWRELPRRNSMKSRFELRRVGDNNL